MTRCRLAIMYSNVQQVAFSESNRYMYVEIDGTTTIDGTIPWCKQQPYARVPYPSLATPNLSAAANGYLHVFQVTNLIADTPATAPAPLSILIFAVTTPQLNMASFRDPTSNNPLTRGIALPNGFLGMDASFTVTKLMAEDDVRSIREIMHTKRNLGSISVVPGALSLVLLYNSSSFHSYFQQMYKYCRGSITYTLSATGCSSTVMDRIRIQYTNAIAGDTVIEWFPALQPRFSVTIPFNDPVGFYSTGVFDTTFVPPTLSLTGTISAGNSFGLDWFVSYNDDLSLGCPCPLPSITWA